MKTRQFREAIRQLLTTEQSNHRIAKNMGVSPHSIKDYRTRLALLNLRWKELKTLGETQLRIKLGYGSQPRNYRRHPDWQEMHRLMQLPGQTRVNIWHSYCKDEPDSALSYQQFCYLYARFVKKLDVTMRQVHVAGECMYIDYAGYRIPWTDPHTGKQCYAQLYVAVMGASNYTWFCACRDQSTEEFVCACDGAIRFFEGAPQALVPDNLKAAVIRAGRFPTFNRTFAELAEFYDSVILPARVRKPQDKSLAEIGVKLVSRWIKLHFTGRAFFSVAEINEALKPLLHSFNEKPFRRLPGCRRSRFEELERPALKPLPQASFEIAQWVSAQRVPADYHVYVQQHAYSVPYALVGEKVEARVTKHKIELFHERQSVACHLRNHTVGGHTTIAAHRPPNHRAYGAQDLSYYSKWAQSIGHSALSLVRAQFDGRPEHSTVACRACSQLKSLASRYGNDRLEAACQCACDIDAKNVTSVHSILKSKIDTRPPSDPEQQRLPLHHNVRGAGYYKGGN